MIKVDRLPKPSVLERNEQKWLNNYLITCQNYDNNTTADNKKKKKNAENKYNHSDIKDGLIRMFHDKCAYCESTITHIGYGHIEHFRPKSLFPQLCFEWTNLLLACEICNGTEFKGDNFPLEEDGGLLINPVDEDPASLFYFEFDEQAGIANVIPKNARAGISERIYGLNRPKLVKKRSDIVQLFAIIAKMAAEGNIDAINKMGELCVKQTSYSAFAFSLAQKYNLL